MAPATQASANNPFQLGEGEERPLLRSSDDTSQGAILRRTTPADWPRFVMAPVEPESKLAIGVAQRSTVSEQAGEIEPASGTDYVQRFRPSEMVVPVPPVGQPSPRFHKLQEYEGEVLSLSVSDFVARLVDLTDKDAQRLEATFSIDEVSPSDSRLLRKGAIFYWIIGFKDYLNGQRKTEQFLRFRRLPIWSRKDLRRLEARVDELKAFLQSDD